MKKFISLFLFVLFIISLTQTSFSQDVASKNSGQKIQKLTTGDNNMSLFTVVTSNGSTSANGRAPQGGRKYINTKYLITAAEMTASGFTGTVYSIGWRWNVPSPPAATVPVSQGIETTGRLIVYLRDTVGTTIGGTFIDTNGTGYTKIIEGTITIPAGTDEINIDVPVGGPGTSLFTPTPGNAVMVIFVYQTLGTLGTPAAAPNVYCLNSGALLTYQSQTVPGVTGSASAFRPETRLGNTILLAADVGAQTNLSPTGTANNFVTYTYAPKASIKNFGFTTQGPFNVTTEITGPVPYTNTKSVSSLAASGATTLTFDSTFTPTYGTYTMKTYTQLAGDMDHANDTTWSTFNVANPNYGGGFSNSGGYYYSNSIIGSGAPSSPEFNWIDPVAAGHTPITFADPDDGTFPVDMGFNFTYMGTTYNTGATNLNIYTNGFLNLGTPVSGAFYGVTSFPNPTTTFNLIALGLIDLDFTNTFYPAAKVYYGGDASKFVVTYYHGYRWVSGGTSTDYITMQIIFFANGNIKFQYNDAESFNYTTTFTPFCDIGMQNSDGTNGLQYRVEGSGGPMFSSPIAVEFGQNQGALPVELASFTSNINRNNVNLNWATASEINNAGFDIERKPAGSEVWNKIGNVVGSGNSTQPKNYSFNDRGLNTGKYNYRLKQIDYNGNFKYFTLSGEVIVGVPNEYRLSQNYPNPFNPTTKIDYDLPFDSKVGIRIYDMLGREVAVLVNDQMKAGYYTVQMNAINFASGTYFFRIIAQGANGKEFVMTKKMQLIK
ncbi:MAG TPA: T9SS type A sorting domain-containing protein [Ignavibacteria bacterium]|nr:T9SS type A sorting domain-containing protein [Ignavibacteria bacterium]